jgi:inner membrane protein
VENLCHTLVGGALARAGLDRLSPLATPTMLVAANLPDADCVSLFWGDLAYLEHHRGVTHGVPGLLVQAPLLAGAVVLLDRLVFRRRREGGAPARFVPLLVVALVGLLSHLLLDFTNSYGVKPWLPFDRTWYYGDIVFIVDPWLWLALGGALFLGARRSWRATAAWLALLAVLAAGVALAPGTAAGRSVGYGPVALWFGILAAVVAARFLAPALDARRLAAASLAVVVVYWCGLWGAHAVAASHAREGVSDAKLAVTPTLMRPDVWRVFAVTPETLETYGVSVSGARTPSASVARNLDDPAARAAMRTCAGAVTVDFSRVLLAEVSPRPDGGATVVLKDGRFSDVPGQYGFAVTRIGLDRSLEPLPDARPCPRFPGSW